MFTTIDKGIPSIYWDRVLTTYKSENRLIRQVLASTTTAYRKSGNTHTFDNTSLRLVLPSFSPRGAKQGFTLASSRLSLCVSTLPVRDQVENRVYLVIKSTQHRRRSVVPLLGPHAFFGMFYASI